MEVARFDEENECSKMKVRIFGQNMQEFANILENGQKLQKH